MIDVTLKRLAVASVIVIAQIPAAIAHENHDRTPNVSMPLVMDSLSRKGQRIFEADCASCHGKQLEGTAKGPSLIPYDKAHHPDGSFVTAMKSGVKQHHWKFGDMPPVEKLTQSEIQNVIAYIREVQDFNADADDDR